MTNRFYTETWTAAAGSQARSRQPDTQFALIQAAFDLLQAEIDNIQAQGGDITDLGKFPATLTGHGLKLLRVNAAASSIEFIAPGNVTIKSIGGTAYTLVAADAGALLLFTNGSPVTVTVPDDVFAQGDVICINQFGGGRVTVAPGSGVDLRSSDALLSTRKQYAQIALVAADVDEFLVIGERNAASTTGGVGAGWAQYLAASLEPDAIEAVQKGTFSYAINSSTTKLLMASFGTRLGSGGRMEQRNPQRFMPLRGVTLAGIVSDGTAIIIDPTAATYADPWATYYDRLEAIAERPVKNLAFTATSQRKPFLPGAYGAIITQYTCFDFTWLALRPLGGTSYGINLWDEISDAATQRVGNSLTLPIHKKCAGSIEASATGSSPLGSVSYVLLPATWSPIADPVASSYTFRADFMDSALDTGVWTRAQSTAGNVEIDTNYQWCKLFGNSSWGANGLRRTTTAARAAGTKLVVDFYVPVGASAAGAFIVGWSDGAGHDYTNFAHGINIGASNVLKIYENGNDRGTVGAGVTEGAIYRVRITQGASSATYEIQGGPEYAALGGASWTTLTPGTPSSSSTTPLTPAASAFAAEGYVSDFRVFS